MTITRERDVDSARIVLRRAEAQDIALLASLNLQLIRDEGHRNQMTEPQLAARMQEWLNSEYEAYLFDSADGIMGYALTREEPDSIYLRQFFIRAERRRQGLGRQAFDLIRAECLPRKPMIRLEVLSNNLAGIAFWRNVGFADYCITMEMTRDSN